jgi:secreted PhoX family phosphatase
MDFILKCVGSLANCSGGRTPWYTVLSCEENFQDDNEKYRWQDQEGMGIDEEHYGWIMEVDPFGELPPVEHTVLGRFRHENAAMRWDGPGKRLVVYMGDDAKDQYLYKFVSARPYRQEALRQQRRQLLHEGTLYAADFSKGRWLALDFNANKAVLEKAGGRV